MEEFNQSWFWFLPPRRSYVVYNRHGDYIPNDPRRARSTYRALGDWLPDWLSANRSLVRWCVEKKCLSIFFLNSSLDRLEKMIEDEAGNRMTGRLLRTNFPTMNRNAQMRFCLNGSSILLRMCVKGFFFLLMDPTDGRREQKQSDPARPVPPKRTRGSLIRFSRAFQRLNRGFHFALCNSNPLRQTFSLMEQQFFITLFLPRFYAESKFLGVFKVTLKAALKSPKMESHCAYSFKVDRQQKDFSKRQNLNMRLCMWQQAGLCECLRRNRMRRMKSLKSDS